MTQMLIKYETLLKDDIEEILNGSWTNEKKEARLKVTEGLQKKTAAPSPARETGRQTPDTPQPQQA